MKKVLVLGSNGQLGRTIQNLSRDLTDEFDFYTSKDLDITDYQLLTNVFYSGNYDYCINCAAFTNVDGAETAHVSAFEVNSSAVKKIALLCKELDIVLIHLSTDFVFDGESTIPYKENDLPNPLNVYGESKLKGEQEVSTICSKYYIIRTSWLYSNYNKNFVSKMIDLAKTKSPINVVSDQIGSPTYANDLAQAIFSIIKLNLPGFGIYHYSNKGVASWYNFAREIFDILKIDVKLKKVLSSDFRSKALRPSYSKLDSSKITSLLKIEIPHWKTSLKDHLVINYLEK